MKIHVVEEFQGPGWADPKQTREQRGQELQGLMRTPEGKDVVGSYFLKYTGILIGEMPPVSLLMVQTILDHEYPIAMRWVR